MIDLGTLLSVNELGAILAAIGGLVLATNVITEVIKKTLSDLPAQITATIVSMVLTLTAFFAYVGMNEITVEWYMVIGAVVGGFFVSYGAQFGFDKLKEIINQFKGVVK